jgi:hypothetical protein
MSSSAERASQKVPQEQASVRRQERKSTERAPGAGQAMLSLQHSAGNRAVTTLLAGSAGQPLDAVTRGEMEERFGEDFGDVRIHNDEDSSASALSAGARAYTGGRDIAFGQGFFAPHTPEGKLLLAHELAHVVQQRRGKGRSSESVAEADARQAAGQAASGNTAVVQAGASGGVQADPMTKEEIDKLIAEDDLRARAARNEDEFMAVQRHRQELLEQRKIASSGAQAPEQVPPEGGAPEPAGDNRDVRWVGPPPKDVQVEQWRERRQAEAALDQAEPGTLAPSIKGKEDEAPKPAEGNRDVRWVGPPPKDVQVEQWRERRQAEAALDQADPDALAPPIKRENVRVLPRKDDASLREAALEIGAHELDKPRGYFPRERDLSGESKRDSAATRLIVRSGTPMWTSIARSHWRSRAEVEQFMQDYITAASEDPATKPLADEALRDRDRILRELTTAEEDVLAGRLKLAKGEQHAADIARMLQVQPPEVVKERIPAGRLIAIPAIKAADALLDFVPAVGQIKTLLEGVSGRTFSGQIEKAIHEPSGAGTPDLDALDRIIRILPLAIHGATQIVSRAPGWVESLARLRKATNLSDVALQKVISDTAKLAGREKEIAHALVVLRSSKQAEAAERLEEFAGAAQKSQAVEAKNLSRNELLEDEVRNRYHPNSEMLSTKAAGFDFAEGFQSTAHTQPKAGVTQVERRISGGKWIQLKILDSATEEAAAANTKHALERAENALKGVPKNKLEVTGHAAGRRVYEKGEEHLRYTRENQFERVSQGHSYKTAYERQPDEIVIHLHFENVDPASLAGKEALGRFEAAAQRVINESQYREGLAPIRLRVTAGALTPK